MNPKPPSTVALIAHDGQKVELLTFVSHHRETLSRFDLMATDSTGERLRSKMGLAVATCGHGPGGGDVAIAAAVAAGKIAAVLFFLDSGTAHPHIADVHALIRQCCWHNTPIALNASTAVAVISMLTDHATELEYASALTCSGQPVDIHEERHTVLGPHAPGDHHHTLERRPSSRVVPPGGHSSPQ